MTQTHEPGSLPFFLDGWAKRPKPLLSVVIPCYNTAPYLAECLDSVLGQTYSNLEVIICDDASTDDSPAIIRDYETRYPGRVRGFFLEQNHGVSFARNYAVAQAQGEYLTPLDSDDYYYDQRKLEYELALTLYYREERGQEVIAYSEAVAVDEDGRYFAPTLPAEQIKQGMIVEDILTNATLPRDFVIRRVNFLNCGEYRLVNGYEDWDMAIRLAARYEFYLTGINGTAYRFRQESLSKGQLFVSPHRLWPVFCYRLERLGVDEQRQEELAYRFGRSLNEVRAGQDTEIRNLHRACVERLQLINELHQTAQERLALIERQQADLIAQAALIKKLSATHPGVWLYRLLPRRLRRFFWNRQEEAR